MVLALPRGGVPIAAEVARALAAPLEALVVRKLGAPMQPELGVGAIAEDGTLYVDERLCDLLGIGRGDVDRIADRELGEIRRRLARYRGGRPLPSLEGREVIVVDDGVATGGTARAAVRAARHLGARRVVFAAPVAAKQAVRVLEKEADEVVVVLEPADLDAIGLWYEDFHQLDDDEVVALLGASRPREPEQEIVLETGEVTLHAVLGVPDHPVGTIVFAHGSGSGRHSPRNRWVASRLRTAGLATVLLDLLTVEEEDIDASTGELRFDIELLTRRLISASLAARALPSLSGLPIGWFGSSTGAAAALTAAGQQPRLCSAVVSRGGRPDLAVSSLPYVAAPTLLIVGANDWEVLELNREALEELRCEKRLVVIPGATHLFEEPGALDAVADHAAGWFSAHLAGREETVRAP